MSIGSWVTLNDESIPEIMASAGFEWLVIDLEHSAIGIRNAARLIRVIDLLGISPLVRVTSNDPHQIKRVMDAGAHGIIVPMINSAQDAREAVSAVRYPPQGGRGVGLARAQGFGTSFKKYRDSIHQCAVVIVQIEHVDAIANLEAILDVDGVDGTIIGPYDLSGSVGKPGEFEDPEVRALLSRYEDVCKRKNKPLGFHVVETDSALIKSKLKAGYSILAFGTDFLFLGNACRNQMKELRTQK
ncbi:MAG TPA: aldolase/citrate lyase family protein [Bdellovibrionota bacterium]|nr:aldolase/citrate lyase family protein [Bdellovibrionota bacterium]